MEDNFANYPEGHFLKPGMTEAPDIYDYPEARFNRPHLTRSDFKENENLQVKNRTYKVYNSNLKNVPALGQIAEADEVKSILADDDSFPLK